MADTKADTKAGAEERERLAAWTAMEWRTVFYALEHDEQRTAFLAEKAARYGVSPAQVRAFFDDPRFAQIAHDASP